MRTMAVFVLVSFFAVVACFSAALFYAAKSNWLTAAAFFVATCGWLLARILAGILFHQAKKRECLKSTIDAAIEKNAP